MKPKNLLLAAAVTVFLGGCGRNDVVIYNFADYKQRWSIEGNPDYDPCEWKPSQYHKYLFSPERLADLEIFVGPLAQKELDYPYVVTAFFTRERDKKNGGMKDIPPAKALDIVFFGETDIIIIQKSQYNDDFFVKYGFFSDICDSRSVIFSNIMPKNAKQEPGVRYVYAPVGINMRNDDSKKYFVSAVETKIKHEFFFNNKPVVDSRVLNEQESREIKRIIKSGRVFKDY